MASALSCRLRQALTASDLQDCIDSCFDAAGIVISTKMGNDDFADDPACECVGKSPLKTVADFDPELAVVSRNQEDYAVVESFFSDLPAPGDLDAEALEVLSLEAGNRQHRDLMAGFVLKSLQPMLKRLNVSGRH